MRNYTPAHAITDAKNATGDEYHSDGKVLVVFLKQGLSRIFANGLETRSRSLGGVLQQAPQRAHPVFPSDLLAFFVGAAPVADADFIDA